MHPVGFSTGALARGDVPRALALVREHRAIRAVEISALRDHELAPICAQAPGLDLSGFDYVSFHAPSKLGRLSETEVFEHLASLPEHWPLVVHPDILGTPSLWRSLGERLCIENMDNRKTLGKNAEELRGLFDTYPKATFCLDVGHARQIDPTMAIAYVMLFDFGARLRQLHVSDVGERGEHLPIGALARWAYERIARLVPRGCPLIIESVVPPERIDREVLAVRAAFAGAKVAFSGEAPSA